MAEVPDWIVAGRPVSVETTTLVGRAGKPRTSVRTYTVQRIGVRYIVVSDSMGFEHKFQTATLSRPATSGRKDVLVPPDRANKE